MLNVIPFALLTSLPSLVVEPSQPPAPGLQPVEEARIESPVGAPVPAQPRLRILTDRGADRAAELLRFFEAHFDSVELLQSRAPGGLITPPLDMRNPYAPTVDVFDVINPSNFGLPERAQAHSRHPYERRHRGMVLLGASGSLFAEHSGLLGRTPKASFDQAVPPRWHGEWPNIQRGGQGVELAQLPASTLPSSPALEVSALPVVSEVGIAVTARTPTGQAAALVWNQERFVHFYPAEDLALLPQDWEQVLIDSIWFANAFQGFGRRRVLTESTDASNWHTAAAALDFVPRQVARLASADPAERGAARERLERHTQADRTAIYDPFPRPGSSHAAWQQFLMYHGHTLVFDAAHQVWRTSHLAFVLGRPQEELEMADWIRSSSDSWRYIPRAARPEIEHAAPAQRALELDVRADADDGPSHSPAPFDPTSARKALEALPELRGRANGEPVGSPRTEWRHTLHIAAHGEWALLRDWLETAPPVEADGPGQGADTSELAHPDAFALALRWLGLVEDPQLLAERLTATDDLWERRQIAFALASPYLDNRPALDTLSELARGETADAWVRMFACRALREPAGRITTSQRATLELLTSSTDARVAALSREALDHGTAPVGWRLRALAANDLWRAYHGPVGPGNVHGDVSSDTWLRLGSVESEVRQTAARELAASLAPQLIDALEADPSGKASPAPTPAELPVFEAVQRIEAELGDWIEWLCILMDEELGPGPATMELALLGPAALPELEWELMRPGRFPIGTATYDELIHCLRRFAPDSWSVYISATHHWRGHGYGDLLSPPFASSDDTPLFEVFEDPETATLVVPFYAMRFASDAVQSPFDTNGRFQVEPDGSASEPYVDLWAASGKVGREALAELESHPDPAVRRAARWMLDELED